MRCLALLWLLVVAAIVLAADLGLARPLLDLVNRVPWGDKICHFLFVGGLCYLISLTLARRQACFAATVIIGTMLAVAVLATIEEFSQLWFTERTFSLGDLACNYAGIVTFGCLAIWSQPKSRDSNED